MFFKLIIASAGTVLLIWGAMGDIQNRTIPVPVGFGMLVLGLAVLIKDSWWIPYFAIYFLFAIWCTRGGIWKYLLIAASLGMLIAFGWEAAPLVAGIVFVAFLFWQKWFGGGDAQLAMGLMGIGQDWIVLAMLFGTTIIAGITETMIRRGGVVEGAKRLAWVAGQLGAEPDDEAIRTPWGVIAAIVGVIYLWIWVFLL